MKIKSIIGAAIFAALFFGTSAVAEKVATALNTAFAKGQNNGNRH